MADYPYIADTSQQATVKPSTNVPRKGPRITDNSPTIPEPIQGVGRAIGAGAQQALASKPFSRGGAAYEALEGPGVQNVMQSADVGIRSLGQQAKEIFQPHQRQALGKPPMQPTALEGMPKPGQPIDSGAKGRDNNAATTPVNTTPAAPGKEYSPTPAAALQGKRGISDIGSQPTSAQGTASPGTGDSGAANMAQRLGGAQEATQPDYGGDTSPRGSQTPNQGALPGPSTKYGEHAWDDGPKKMGGTFSVLPSAGSGGRQALSGQSGQQPGGGSSMDLRDLYNQAMTPIDTSQPLMKMMAQVSQRKQARALLEQGIHAQSGVDAANAAGEWSMKRGQQTGQYKLAEQGIQGQQALEQGQQTGAFAREREQMGNESAQAIEGQREGAAGQRQDQALDTTRRGQDMSALTTLAGQRSTREGREAQQGEARRKEFSRTAEDQVINKLLQSRAMPESAYDYVKGEPHYNENRARAYARQILGSDAADSSRAGEDPMGESTPQQASNVASEVMVTPGESNWFSADKAPTVTMQRSALPARPEGDEPSSTGEFDKEAELKQSNKNRTK